MSVRFVVGRAGSGKTWRCLESIRARLRENPAEGNKLLLLVPEQASFQMERALIETPDIPGFTRCEVLSFQRLAYRIFSETGSGSRKQGLSEPRPSGSGPLPHGRGSENTDQTIGSLGRLMVIRRLIRREKSALRLLERVADKPGLVKQVAGTIEELMRERVDPAKLADLAERQRQSNPLASARIADITRLYLAYLDYLIDDRLDPAQYLNLAAERLSGCLWLRGAEVWVDGFAGFTTQEYELLTRLAGYARSINITLLLDPGASAIDRQNNPLQSYSLFARTERTLVRLRNDLHAAGIEFAEPVRLPESRFKAPDLIRLETHLFSGISGNREQEGVSSVSIHELPDRRAEVDAAIAEIKRLTREGSPPMRYRDIAIIVRDLAPYHDLISAAMRAHGIPCFIDRRQPTTHHPLIELVRSLLLIATDDCRLDSVRLTLKTGLLPLSADDADLLENYLLAHGIQGRESFGRPWSYTRFFRHKPEEGGLTEAQQLLLRRINLIREGWLSAVGSWLDAADQHEAPGRTWAESLYGCLEAMNVGGRLQQWADEAEADGRAEEADAHRQVWLDFIELLDEFVRALGTEPMRVREFRETMEAALAEFNLGLAPPTLDQVLVGGIERSRHPNIRAALVLGFDESHFPMKRSEDPLLGDAERESLESAGVEIGPSRRQQLLDERMLAYIALTRAGERLWISFPRSDADGKPLQPSPYLADILAALPDLQVRKWGDPRAERKPEWLTRPGELAGRLAGEFRARPVVDQDREPALRATWNTLYDVARGNADWRRTLTRSLAGLKYCNAAELAPGMMARAIATPFVASVSRLERFAACPFAHFVEYTLGLEPRVEADLADVDLGTLCHAVLEKFVHELATSAEGLDKLEDDDIAERIDRIAGQIVPQLSQEMMLGEHRNAYLFDRSRGHLRRVVRWQRDAARVGRFRPRAVEYPFGFTGRPGAPLKLVTPGGRTILLRGKIDRVDVAELGEELLGAVIDYKRTTTRKLDLTQVFHGLALQLVGYMLAIQQSGESLTGRPIRPVAAFYLPLLEPYQSVSHPSKEKTVSYQWRGIADAGALETLDNTVQPGGKSKYLSARLTRDGQPYGNSDLAQRAQLADLMAHVGRRMGELADSILDGNIAVDPYRLRRQMPCAYCEYRAVCRYEIETQPPKTLEILDKPEVFRRIAPEKPDA